jgi:hypothetical protein
LVNLADLFEHIPIFMTTRLTYALIGCLFGAFAGFVVWWVLGFGVWHRGALSIRGAGLIDLAKYMAAIGAVLGFVLKDRVGDIAGGVIEAVFHIRMGTSSRDPWHAPTWLIAEVLIAVLGIAWRFAR